MDKKRCLLCTTTSMGHTWAIHAHLANNCFALQLSGMVVFILHPLLVDVHSMFHLREA